MEKRGLFIGRFQPFHLGHLEALKWILSREDRVVIGIGSSQYSHTHKNPFTLGERIEMIWRVLKQEGILDKCLFASIPDTDEVHSLWVAQVKSCCPPFSTAYSNDPLTILLFKEAGIPVMNIPFFKRTIYEGTRIREMIAKGDREWEKLVHPEVAKFIREIKGEDRLRSIYINKTKEVI
ncbi:MAG: nicotinamide-nucleotide adenylyltransferase [Thermoproteales archaeon]|nr:nicotinamide-nucleotide adenylyltransferase [Thermoproteales archaeon]